MSKLEELARKKVLQKQQKQAQIEVGNVVESNDSNSGASLLGKLRKSYQDEAKTQNTVPKLTLSERLKKTQKGVSPHETPKPVIASSKPVSLSSRLNNLKGKSTRLDQLKQHAPVKEVLTKNENVSKESDELKPIRQLLDQFQKIKEQDTTLEDHTISLNHNKSELFKVDGHISKSDNNKMKRNYDNIFTVYYPLPKKSKIVTNFKRLSPDDVVIEAQAQAFNNVTKKVSGLAIKPPKRLQKNQNGKHTSENKAIIAKDYVFKNNINPTCNIITLGHSGSGKSTILGKLLHDLSIVSVQDINDLKLHLERSQYKENINKYWSWVMDYDIKKKEEMKKTTRNKYFSFENRNFELLDTPGDKSAISRQIISNISNSDVALLVIDCSTDGFENGFNLNGQTIEHCILAQAAGIKKMIIAMNKMDSVDWYEGRFNDIKNELDSFLVNIGFNEENLSWIPCSGVLQGNEDGIFNSVPKQLCPWFNNKSDGTIYTLLSKYNVEIAQNIRRELINDEEKPNVISINKINSAKSIINGTVRSGSLQPGQIMKLWPRGIDLTIRQVFVGVNSLREVPITIENDSIGFSIEEDLSEIRISEGDLITSSDYNMKLSAKDRCRLILLSSKVYKFNIEVGNKFKLYLNWGHEREVKVNKILNHNEFEYEVIVELCGENQQQIPLIKNDVFVRNNQNRTFGIGKIIL